MTIASPLVDDPQTIDVPLIELPCDLAAELGCAMPARWTVTYARNAPLCTACAPYPTLFCDDHIIGVRHALAYNLWTVCRCEKRLGRYRDLVSSVDPL